MGKKYYAVAKGKTQGIFNTWEECKQQVEHVPGAVFKSFPTFLEAADYIEEITGNRIEEVYQQMVLPVDVMPENTTPRKEVGSLADAQENVSPAKDHLVAYVDGSYEHTQLRYSFGCVLVLENRIVTLQGSDNLEEYVSMRNVAGEILGSQQAVTWAVENGYKSVTIYYDYEGIEKWAKGSWKTNKIGTQRYKAFMDEMSERIRINFCKVAAHTGVKYNEMADRLAKEALGIL